MTGGSIIILGGSGGIGAALAARLSKAGTAVHMIGRDAAKLSAAAASLPGSVTTAVADVRDVDALNAAIEAAPKPILGLAYAIGSIILKPLKAATATDYADAFYLNVTAAALAVKAALPHVAPGAGVVLFSSIAAQVGFGNHAIIGAAKAGVEGLTRALAAELSPNVRVNAVAPSLTDTPLAKMFTSNEAMAKSIAALHPIPRLGTADDSAALAAFLLSNDAAWITGEIISVAGGRAHLRPKG